MLLSLLLLYLSFMPSSRAVTVYGQTPLAVTSTGSVPMPTKAAYDKTVLKPPPPPSPPSTAFNLDLQPQNTSVPNLSIPQSGAFFGFSIEMSVVNQVFGKNSSLIQVPFLNLMGNLQHRAGRVHIRCGGNTQEFATYVESLDQGRAIAKEQANLQNPTLTPAVLYTKDFFYILSNISSLVNVKWFLGLPFNDTTNWRLQIAEFGEAILGDNLLGLQAGNEPDLYAAHGHRPPTYSPFDYFGEFGNLVQALADNTSIPVRNNLIAPSVATGDWIPEMVWDTGFIEAYSSSLTALAVEHYPNNNCFAQFGGSGSEKIVQDEFIKYLNHTAGQALVAPYLNSSRIAQAARKPFYMFETNTASCGGFPGISDSFGAALWALDYGFQMAHSNFSGAMVHVGGQNVYYNPFTAPPTNESTFHQWTIGSIFYSVLVMAEAFGSSNTSQIIDLNANNGNIFTPAYVIYERGVVSKVALFNYVTDPSGASDYTVTIAIGGGNTGAPNATPAQVKVKYFLSDSVSTKDNIRWANQTFGLDFQVDGHLKGDINIQTIDCDQTTNTCQVKVPAPGFALVFVAESVVDNPSDITFETTAYTKLRNTATYDPAVLATSNGMSGKERAMVGSTSFGSSSDGLTVHDFTSCIVVFGSMMLGSLVVREFM